MLPAAVIGDVFADGAALRAGILPGDRVLEINDHRIRYWEELENTVRQSAGKELQLRISRNGKVFERYVTPIEETVRERNGRITVVGWAGITRAPFIPRVGVIDRHSPAARAGLGTGDLIISVDGQAVRNWTNVEHHLGRVARRTSIVYFRGTEIPGVPQIELLGAGFADLVPASQIDSTLHRKSYTGLEHAEMFVRHVDAGSPARTAGLRADDLVVALDDEPVAHWRDLDQRLQAEPNKTFKLTWKRAADEKTETMSAELKQEWVKQFDEYGHTVSLLTFGAHNDVDRGTVAMVAIDGRFGYALSKGLERTGETIVAMASGFFQILSGETPGDALGGPLALLQAASGAGNQGWDSFFLMIALVSVNLGLINLLPIPMLDGGHLLVFALEGARRRPLAPKLRERIQLGGLILIGLITVLALRNDVLRFFFP